MQTAWEEIQRGRWLITQGTQTINQSKILEVGVESGAKNR